MTIDSCPVCNSTLIDTNVPDSARELYEVEHFTRAIAVLRENDVYLRCPDCGHEWK
jgi:predicted RNA-binding Zn-ribbon protein involved in translation (DUF1610 family)